MKFIVACTNPPFHRTTADKITLPWMVEGVLPGGKVEPFSAHRSREFAEEHARHLNHTFGRRHKLTVAFGKEGSLGLVDVILAARRPPDAVQQGEAQSVIALEWHFRYKLERDEMAKEIEEATSRVVRVGEFESFLVAGPTP